MGIYIQVVDIEIDQAGVVPPKAITLEKAETRPPRDEGTGFRF